MASTSNQNRDQAAPLQLMEPDLAAWAEKITISSTNDRRGLWYGAALFWIVVACIIAARIAFVDPSRIQPATAHSTLAGASSASHDTKL
ncbi:hypothetical protein [Bradyrhizobium sp.]|jgi:hypothetical protein|uniref:hypothetical protein n=1 Tax=Bradyrhizobium sp. TaxID=376 RepID=UPI002DF7E0EA|nr:hypothetical protein [Bradyrhizobium sp.]